MFKSFKVSINTDKGQLVLRKIETPYDPYYGRRRQSVFEAASISGKDRPSPKGSAYATFTPEFGTIDFGGYMLGKCFVDEQLDEEFDLTGTCKSKGGVPVSLMDMAQQMFAKIRRMKIRPFWVYDAKKETLMDKESGLYLNFIDNRFPCLLKEPVRVLLSFSSFVLEVEGPDSFFIKTTNGTGYSKQDDFFEHEVPGHFYVNVKMVGDLYELFLTPGKLLTAGLVGAPVMFEGEDKFNERKTQRWKSIEQNGKNQLYNPHTESYLDFDGYRLITSKSPGKYSFNALDLNMSDFIFYKKEALKNIRIKNWKNFEAKQLAIGREQQRKQLENIHRFWAIVDAAEEELKNIVDKSKDKIHKFATAAAAGNLQPVPLLGVAIDMAMSYKMAQELGNDFKVAVNSKYFQQKVITATVTQTASMALEPYVKPILDEVSKAVTQKFNEMMSKVFVQRAVTETAKSQAGAQSAKTTSQFVPGVGQIIGAATSYYFACSVGMKLVQGYKKAYQDALNAQVRKGSAKFKF